MRVGFWMNFIEGSCKFLEFPTLAFVPRSPTQFKTRNPTGTLGFTPQINWMIIITHRHDDYRGGEGKYHTGVKK
jgi:hypothetical protein